jgi:hypothetical protein
MRLDSLHTPADPLGHMMLTLYISLAYLVLMPLEEIEILALTKGLSKVKIQGL